eukprot:scaffold98277_cov57-Phaeocystis_antarctica.AAC.2
MSARLVRPSDTISSSSVNTKPARRLSKFDRREARWLPTACHVGFGSGDVAPNGERRVPGAADGPGTTNITDAAVPTDAMRGGGARSDRPVASTEVRPSDMGHEGSRRMSDQNASSRRSPRTLRARSSLDRRRT